MKKKSKLKNMTSINLDDIIKRYDVIDVLEVAELRGVEYKVPRQISNIAERFFVSMRKGKAVNMRVPDVNLIFEIRHMLLDDLDQLGLPFGKRTICADKDGILTFWQVPSRIGGNRIGKHD